MGWAAKYDGVFFVKVSAADCFHNVFTKKQFSSSFVFSAGVLFVCGETVYCRYFVSNRQFVVT